VKGMRRLVFPALGLGALDSAHSAYFGGMIWFELWIG
jgi:hypothetical protein